MLDSSPLSGDELGNRTPLNDYFNIDNITIHSAWDPRAISPAHSPSLQPTLLLPVIPLDPSLPSWIPSPPSVGVVLRILYTGDRTAFSAKAANSTKNEITACIGIHPTSKTTCLLFKDTSFYLLPEHSQPLHPLARGQGAMFVIKGEHAGKFGRKINIFKNGQFELLVGEYEVDSNKFIFKQNGERIFAKLDELCCGYEGTNVKVRLNELFKTWGFK